MAELLVMACKIWLSAGLLVGLWFVCVVGRVDPAARGAFAFRPLLLPGVALLWPFVVWRWRALARRSNGGH